MKKLLTMAALVATMVWGAQQAAAQVNDVAGDAGAAADVETTAPSADTEIQADAAADATPQVPEQPQAAAGVNAEAQADANANRADNRRARNQNQGTGDAAVDADRDGVSVEADADQRATTEANRQAVDDQDARERRGDRNADSARDGRRDARRDGNRDDDRQARWRFKQHNGEWWYWSPANYWMYHRDGNWQRYNHAEYRPSRRYSTGYRGYYNGPRHDDGRYYYDENGYRYYRGYDPYRDQNFGRRGYRPSDGERAGAAIGGAVGGRDGANVGRAIGDLID